MRSADSRSATSWSCRRSRSPSAWWSATCWIRASGLHLTEAVRHTGAAQAEGAGASTVDFLLGIIPTTMRLRASPPARYSRRCSSRCSCGFALQGMGPAGAAVLRGIEHIQRLVFRVLAMIMWAAPVGAFGAMAAVVGETGVDALKSLAVIMIGFYVTCALFVFVILGTLLRLISGDEYLQAVRSTSAANSC